MSSEQLSIELYNATVAALKQKMYQKGNYAILQYFTAVDGKGSGKIGKEDFMKALNSSTSRRPSRTRWPRCSCAR